MSQKVKCIRLNTGEVLIGFVSSGLLSYKITDAQVLITSVEDGNFEVNLAPWIPYAKEYSFQVWRWSVMSVFDAKPQLETNFKVATGNKTQRGK
tara:strand:- start:223 stop:504 length:282 start_codon:yes stop_codon:yes gene_type:complete